MAKNDRCSICDYTTQYGSPSAGISPGQNGLVRKRVSPSGSVDYLCQVCLAEIIETFVEYGDPDDGVGGTP